MPEFLSTKQLQDLKDVREAIEKIQTLQRQIQQPNRFGMISALSDAKAKAPVEITAVEFSQGDTHWMPFDHFSDNDLYRKLSQYQKGLIGYCIEKIGKEAFDELMKGK